MDTAMIHVHPLQQNHGRSIPEPIRSSRHDQQGAATFNVDRKGTITVVLLYAARASRLGRLTRMKMYTINCSVIAPEQSISTSQGVDVRLGRNDW